MTSSDKRMDHALGALPLLQPRASVWNAMDAAAGRMEHKARQRRRLRWTSYGMAASLLVGVAGYQIAKQSPQVSPDLQQTIETAVRSAQPQARHPELRRSEGQQVRPDGLLVSAPSRSMPTTSEKDKEADKPEQKQQQESVNEF